MPDRMKLIVALRAISDQDWSLARDWWAAQSVEERRNILVVLCNPNVTLATYRNLNDEALSLIRDLAILAVTNLTIGTDEEIVL